MKSDLVKTGYDNMARIYMSHRDELKSDKYVRKLIRLLPKNSLILDVGCGGGVPIDDILLRSGHSVVGIDVSSEMVKIARDNCPLAEYVVRDMRDLQDGEYEVDAIVSFYALFHVKRDLHSTILRKFASFLPKGGMLLLTMGDRDFEGKHELYGETVWSSHYGREKNRSIVEKSGFEIILDEIDKSGRESHQILIARKR